MSSQSLSFSRNKVPYHYYTKTSLPIINKDFPHKTTLHKKNNKSEIKPMSTISRMSQYNMFKLKKPKLIERKEKINFTVCSLNQMKPVKLLNVRARKRKAITYIECPIGSRINSNSYLLQTLTDIDDNSKSTNFNLRKSKLREDTYNFGQKIEEVQENIENMDIDWRKLNVYSDLKLVVRTISDNKKKNTDNYRKLIEETQKEKRKTLVDYFHPKPRDKTAKNIIKKSENIWINLYKHLNKKKENCND